MYSYNGIDKALRVFDINPNTLALAPHHYTTSYPGMVGSPEEGFIYGLGHADLAIDPYDGNQDVIVGVENCGNVGSYVPGIHTVNGAPVGQVIMVRLSDGQATSLDDPRNEAGIAHVSTRNIDRPGWAYISFYYGTKGQGGARYADEVVALKLDGSGTAKQLAYEHSDYSVGYYAYPMAVPSPYGNLIDFASNWAHDGNGDPTVYQDYVVSVQPPTSPAGITVQSPAPVAQPVGSGVAKPVVGTGSSAAPAGSPWKFTVASGVAGNSSTVTAAPQGTGPAWLQNGGSISQSVSFAVGNFTLTFSEAQSGNYLSNLTIRVQLDGKTIAAATPWGPSYTVFTTSPFTLRAGKYTIRFVGLGVSDRTGLLDWVGIANG
jgi:hypothetical protein